MLRRRLLIMLALLTTLMLATAISSVLLMRGVLQDLEHINDVAMTNSTASNNLGVSITSIEAELLEWAITSKLNTQRVIELADGMRVEISSLRDRYTTLPLVRQTFAEFDDSWTRFDHSLSKLVSNPIDLKIEDAGDIFSSVNEIRQASLNHSTATLERMKLEQIEVTAMFRLMAIILAGIFVVLINVSIILLIRAASSVLKPVDRLVEASRHLAHEDYDYRVEVGRKDEFDELAQSFNNLAKHLQQNEQRKIETLHQVARTLNHELNNAIAIIELQLRIVEKSSAHPPQSSGQLKLIYDTLHKMNLTVTSLTHVRRVVLTDYIKGVKMLDLKLSTQAKTPSDDTTEEIQRASSV